MGKRLLSRRLGRYRARATLLVNGNIGERGLGDYFELRAQVMRLGSRVASTRMEFLGADGKLLSTAAGAYIVS